MMPKPGYHLSAFWGPRRESPAALARRWLATVRQLQPVHPILAEWYRGVDSRGVRLPLDAEAIEAIITEGSHDDGYTLDAKTDVKGSGPRLFELDIRVASNWMNAVIFGTDFRHVPDASITTYPIFKSAVVAIAENFGAERAYAYSSQLLHLWQRPPNPYPPFPIAWISYCAPRITHLVAPPRSAIVEHRPDGGLLMAATDETFDVDNSAHMAVAREIEAAVAPLHCTRPWEPEQ